MIANATNKGNGNGSPISHHARVRLLDGDDFKCALMGSLGFSTKLIMAHTELTPAQIAYRLRLGGIKRKDYRDGESPLAALMLRRARSIAIPKVTAHLRRVLPKTCGSLAAPRR